MKARAPRPIKRISNVNSMQDVATILGLLYSDTARDMTDQVNAVDGGLVL